MKEKKANWFTRNSWWFFIVLLVVIIVLINYFVEISQRLIRYGINWEFEWPIAIFFTLTILGIIVIFILMYFLIYIEDNVYDRNKKKVALFESLIQKYNIKGEKIEKN